MEHSHVFPNRLTPGCPACEQLAEARDRAIGHLYEALYLLAGLRGEDDPATIRLNLAPITFTGDFARLCHNIDLSAKQAEALSDAIDSMNAYAGSEALSDDQIGEAMRRAESAIDVDSDSLARRKAEFMAWLEGQSGEDIASGEWSAAAVAKSDPDLYADVSDLFASLDPIEITDKVIRDREADLAGVAQVLDELYGDVPYPYAEEDVPLPHDQTQMDALTAEVEKHLQDGGE